MLLGNSSGEQLENGSNGLKGDGIGGDGIQLKKGPWTAAEDAILTEFVRKHGEGNWNSVQRNTGLARCGKSCRLRWANHLRPNLKKGTFSPEEERLIVELHAQLGNKWARMAAQLPGRTDNEIKNYWNTRVKRRHRQGLPLYPPDIQPQHQQQSHSQPTTSSTPTSSFSFQTAPTPTPNNPNGHHHHHHHHHHSYPPPCYAGSPTAPLSPTPPPLSPNLQSPRHPAFPTLTLFDTNSNNISNVNNANISNVFNIPRTPPTLQNPQRLKRFLSHTNISNIGYATANNNSNNNNNGTGSSNFQESGNFSLQLSRPLRSPSLSSLLNDPQSHCNTSTFSNTASKLLSLPSFSSLPGFFNTPNSSSVFRTLDEKDCILSNGLVFALKPELPSRQLLSQNGNAELNFDNEKLSGSCSGSGLLEDLLEEAQALACNYGESSRRVSEEKREFSGFNHWNDSSSLNLSSGMKPKEEAGSKINNMHEELSNLLNVIPSMQVPEWYTDCGEASHGQSSVVSDENIGLEMQQIASLFRVDSNTDLFRVDSNTDQDRPPGSCSFDNLPGIC